jgi:hypothetical protein
MKGKFNPTLRDYGMISWKNKVELKEGMNLQ